MVVIPVFLCYNSPLSWTQHGDPSTISSCTKENAIFASCDCCLGCNLSCSTERKLQLQPNPLNIQTCFLTAFLQIKTLSIRCPEKVRHDCYTRKSLPDGTSAIADADLRMSASPAPSYDCYRCHGHWGGLGCETADGWGDDPSLFQSQRCQRQNSSQCYSAWTHQNDVIPASLMGFGSDLAKGFSIGGPQMVAGVDGLWDHLSDCHC